MDSVVSKKSNEYLRSTKTNIKLYFRSENYSTCDLYIKLKTKLNTKCDLCFILKQDEISR